MVPVKILLIAAALLCPSLPAIAQQDALTRANNPLADVSAFNNHNYYIGELTGIERPGNVTWARYARPLTFGETSWLARFSLPVSSLPLADGDREFGLGDFNAFAAWIIDTGNPAISFGIGPQITIPTASDDALGSGKWSLGLANVLFDARNKAFQWGYLLTWQASVAGDSDRDDVSTGAFQPVGLLQLGGGWYLRSSGTWTYDFEHDAYSVPVGLGLGRVIATERIVYNAFIEPQVSIADDGPGQPDWQVFAGVNLQFN